MCGILGGNIKSWDYEKGLLSMRHRGPDGKRIIKYDNFVLGFVRLSIRDLSDLAMQPMCSCDNNISIVFNGELYGVEELKKDLAPKYTFTTTSDTEVLLYAYMEYGEAFINKIEGMFAIAIYDKRRGAVTLYRDRIGIKPLYYLYDGRRFCFASELKGIVNTCNDAMLEYDVEALYDYFTYEYIPEPKSMYKRIYKLEPANKIVYYIEENRLESPVPYWTLKVNGNQGMECKQDDVIEGVKSVITDTVKKQMVSDVEVGTFLSGGIDSSIITVTTSLLGNKLKAFSIGFEVGEDDAYFDESEFARILSERYELPLIQKTFCKSDLEEIYDNISEWYDEPFAGYSCYPTYFVSKLVKQNGVTVVLTGDGGDEIFGGYPRFREFEKELNEKHINSRKLSEFYYKYMYTGKHSRFINELLEEIALYGVKVDWYGIKEKRKLLREIGVRVPKDYDDFWYLRKYDNPELPPITRAQVIDFHTYLPSACLQKVDRATMQWSIEARVPLCSKEVAEFAFSLSERDRCANLDLKGLLKKAYSGIVPDEILYKRKKGFTFPPSYKREGTKRTFDFRKSLFDLCVANDKIK